MYDVLVIGGGSGGYAAAIRASQLGAKVALAEGGEIGGTCVNHGCIPTKVWLRAASFYRDMDAGKEFGINATAGPVDFKTIIERKNGVAGDIKAGMQGLLQNNKVDVVMGKAVLKGSGRVDVDGKQLEAKRIILATGSRLDSPDIPGLGDAALTSDQVLDLDKLPASVLIQGTIGPIEAEMAVLLKTFGTDVAIAVDGPRILPREDQDTSSRISQAFRQQGIKLIPRMKLISVEKSKKGFTCKLAGKKEQDIEVENVLVCSRKPAVENMGLETAGVKFDEDGSVKVNDYLETSAREVYAIGDVTGGWMLSHSASSMAVFAAENAMGKRKQFPYHLIPRGLWTFPQVGAVGLSEEEAEKNGYDVETGSFPYSINGLAMTANQADGAVKIISDSQYGEILGVHIVGACATELVGEAALAMQLECTASELARGIRVHPTFSETIVDASRDVMSWALYLPKR